MFNFEKSDIDYVFTMVKSSSYVSKNKMYLDMANNTAISLSQKTVVNAYAQRISESSYRITFLTGICNAFIALAYGLADYEVNKDLATLKKVIRSTCKSAISGGVDEHAIRKALESGNVQDSNQIGYEAQSYALGMAISVMGHELGHVCLGHLHSNEGSLTVSRNDERQADLFASSVVATTPFAKYCVLGNLFVEVMFSWFGPETAPATTHPYSRERVMNMINSTDEILAAYGFNKDNILDFLPTDDDFIEDVEDKPTEESEWSCVNYYESN